MATVCPTCRNPFADDDVSVARDLAYCRGCDKGHVLSELVHGTVVGDTDLSAPPAGAWYRDDGMEVVVGATGRSAAIGGFFLLFSGFWNLVTWGMLIAMIAGSSNVNGPGITHVNGQTVVGIMAYLFMIPFVLVGLGTAAGALMALCGRCEVTIRGVEAVLFRGVGGTGWRTRFDASTVTGVAIKRGSWTKNNQPVYQIELSGPDIKFGSGLSEQRRQFVAAALNKVLVGR